MKLTKDLRVHLRRAVYADASLSAEQLDAAVRTLFEEETSDGQLKYPRDRDVIQLVRRYGRPR